MEVQKISQDTVDILFHPKENLEVGDSIKLIEKGDNKRGIVVQIIELKSVDYQSLLEEQLRKVTAEPFEVNKEYVVEEELSMFDMKNLKIASAKIRKEVVVENGNEHWKGWDVWTTKGHLIDKLV